MRLLPTRLWPRSADELRQEIDELKEAIEHRDRRIVALSNRAIYAEQHLDGMRRALMGLVEDANRWGGE